MLVADHKRATSLPKYRRQIALSIAKSPKPMNPCTLYLADLVKGLASKTKRLLRTTGRQGVYQLPKAEVKTGKAHTGEIPELRHDE